MPLLEGDAALNQPIPPMPTPSATMPITATPLAPVVKTIDPLPSVKRPSLALDIVVAPGMLVVGETAMVSVTVANLSDTPAEALTLTIPVPDKVVVQSGPVVNGKQPLWRWDLGRLDPQAQTTATATFKVTGALKGDAVIFGAEAIARDMPVAAAWSGGALVTAQRQKHAAQAFQRGQKTTLQSADGRVTVELPGDAAPTDLTVTYTPPDDILDPTALVGRLAPAATRAAKRAMPASRRGFGAFTLTATDPAGIDVRQFTKPVTLTLRYTPEQLSALGLREAALGLFWFDEAQQQWVAVPSTVDADARTVTASVNHFSTWQLGDQRTPSEAYVPSLQGFQASLFTGAATYRIPIEVPAGPGGLKPDISLSYSSAATDGPDGERRNSQAGWVGKGWTLDAGGYIARNISTVGETWDYFSLVFGGRSFDIVRGEPTGVGSNGRTCTDYSDANKQWVPCWKWNAVDENFVKVRAVAAGGNDYTWQAWTTDGTRYDFTQQLWSHDGIQRYVYKYLLTQVTDTHGNRITYQYLVNNVMQGSDTYQPAAALQTIFWGYDGATPGTGTARYTVSFGIADRNTGATAGVDSQWDYPKRYEGDTYLKNVAPHEMYRLDWFAVQSWPAGQSGYQLVRQYVLRYESTAYSIGTDDYNPAVAGSGQRNLTLTGVLFVGNDWQTMLPATSFSYYTDPGSGNPRPAGYNRLKTADNGYGGRITFTYDHPWTQASDPTRWPYLRNYHRLISSLAQDVSGQAYSTSALTTYAYAGPAVNDRTNAATWWYARYPSNNQDNLTLLAHPENWEFRGHSTVTVTTYDGNTVDSTRLLRTTRHSFYQGNVNCTPTLTNNVVNENDSCFQEMRRQEGWKGREYQTDTFASNGVLLERTATSYTRAELPFYGTDSTQSGNYKRAGLWRAFNAVQQITVSAYEGGGTPQNRTTIYGYDINTGNTTRIEERSETGAMVRVTNRYYLTRNGETDPSYMVDRMWGENVYDGAGNLLALTHRFFDNTANPQAQPTKGDLRLERRYFDTTQLLGTDTGYDYDQWGNRTRVTTYAGVGSYNGSANTPGNGSAARTTTTEYDAVFRALPVKVTNPLGHVETATYDYRMGTVTQVTDANGQSTWGEYDVFGRVTKLTQTPDDPSYGTRLFWYYDNEWPVRYVTEERGGGPVDYYRDSTVFYDGLGRQIHTKQESGPWSSQAIIVDKRYDALGRLVAESQPRYVQEDGWAMWYYTTIPPANQPLYQQTAYTYDALDRPLVTTMPDGTTTERHYGIVNDGGVMLRYDDVIDANRHRTQTRTDALGRRVQALEITGDCGAWQYGCSGSTTTPWAASTTTKYTYDGLDQLKQVRDAVGNITSMQYDSAGRKTSMSDPDMGTWSYTYDANGNLQTQRDARGQTIWFGYDALDRLITKRNGSASGAELAGYAYDDSWATNGKGRRTRAWTNGTLLAWQYDERGNVNYQELQVAGVTRYLRSWYDSANRLSTLLYMNSGEWVGYEYDMAGRPNKLCSLNWNLPCYVSNATYNALGQMLTRTRGDGKTDQWVYDHPQSWLTGEYVGNGNHTYTYDAGGNITTNTDNNWGQTQNYTYDNLDRLTHAWTTGGAGYPPEGGRPGMAYDQWYSYDLIGNMTSKAGTSYSYPAAGQSRPHAPTQVGSISYSYDANGNTTRMYQSSSSRRIERAPRWNALNQMDQFTRTEWVYVSGGACDANCPQAQSPSVQSSSSSTTDGAASTGAIGPSVGTWQVSSTFGETYTYDADGERVARTANGATTLYLGGVWEEEPGQGWRASYQFNGEVVAKQTNWQGNVSYPLADRLGSATSAYDVNGTWTGGNEYDPWGGLRVALGAMQSESVNYTGQLRDGSGLLYYRARYYDPALGRFISPDTVVPGSGALTLAPSDATAQAAWAQKSGGPADPQNLNRYSYVLNNPVNNTDPSGHCVFAGIDTLACAAAAAEVFVYVVGLAAAGYAIVDGVQQTARLAQDGGVADALTKPTTLEPGPYAKDSIPARGPERDFTPEERKAVDDLGYTNGCHTCGAKNPGTKSGHYVPDHQPPNALNPTGEQQRLYPHCITCSKRQGGEIRNQQRSATQQQQGVGTTNNPARRRGGVQYD